MNNAIFYNALLKKDPEFEGIFFVGVKTTGVFCRPTCPARKPKYENCEFYTTAKEALLSGYRPCLRCKPLSNPNQVSNKVIKLVEAIENNPEKRWKSQDFRDLGVDESTARRQFKKRFGMTFVEYARNRRMGIALGQIRAGEKVIDAQLNMGYESSSGFRGAFSKIMGKAPTKFKDQHNILKSSWYDSLLGPMLIIVDDKELVLLEFVERRGLEREIEVLRKKTDSIIIPGRTSISDMIEQELKSYFVGELSEFKTPIKLLGSDFQKQAWNALIKIPFGDTRSYLQQALAIEKPKSYRAVANANGANQLAIIVPCHRIINNNGQLGGYGGGIQRKKWLIEHERANKKNFN